MIILKEWYNYLPDEWFSFVTVKTKIEQNTLSLGMDLKHNVSIVKLMSPYYVWYGHTPAICFCDAVIFKENSSTQY